ncbi:MAG: M28 family peptidase [Candidatus Glassbacteria bacterium]
MKSRVTLIALAIAIPFLVGFGGGGENLVLIHKTDGQSFASLKEYDVKPHLKGEGWVLASSPTGAIDLIRQAGFEAKVIDDAAWSGVYYLVSGPRGESVSSIPPSFLELARVPEGVIVKGADEYVGDLLELGLRVARIHDTEIPLVERRAGVAGKMPEVWYGPESYAVEQVSDSTITDYINRLVAFQTRYSYSDSVYAASQYIYDKFIEFGYTNVYFDSLSFPGPIQRNVVAAKLGTQAPDKVLVIGGHYDSVTYDSNCDPDTLAPGADDDGSGTVVTMEAARILVGIDTDVTLIFVPFAAEEQGLYGSHHFAQEAYNQGMDIVLMFNYDMVANSDSYWDFEINTASPSNPYAQVLSTMASTYTDLIPFISYGVSAGSDHYWFHEFGYLYVYSQEGDFSPNWHRCTDTVDNINIPYLTDVAEMTVASIIHIANTPQIPTGLTVVNVGDGRSVFVDWNPNPEMDVTGYNIYYGTQSGTYDSLKTVSTVGDTLKNLEEGTTFYIALSAFDGDGYESFLSEEKEIQVGGRPLPPTGLNSASYQDSVVLEWEPNQGELDIAGYNVYRRVPDGPPPTLLGFVPDPVTIFTDDTAEPHILYSYYVTAVDTQVPPNESDPSDEVFGRLATHDLGILVVDHTNDGTGQPYSPTDEEVDDFYEDLLSDYNLQAVWDMSDSLENERAIMDYDIGIYSTVVWHSDVRLGQSMASDTTTMKKFLDSGGNLWLSGWMLMEALTDESGPLYVFDEGEFIRHYMVIDSARTTSNGDTDFIGAEGIQPGFPSVYIDSEKVPLGALFSTDLIFSPVEATAVIYSYVSSDSAGSPFHGLPVGVANDLFGFGLVITDFPAYFMNSAEAREMAAAVMEFFGEPVSVEGEDVSRLPLTYSLSQNYPNPFNPLTMITFEIPGDDEEASEVYTTLSIFDVRGRLVRNLVDGELTPGRYQVSWDGKNGEGREVSSGIYFYRIVSGSFVSTRKMILVK